MTPNVDDRLASIVRALSEVVLPHLPPEASLAQEQVHLAIGHLQLLRAQYDGGLAYEREELEDAIAIGKALAEAAGGHAGDLNSALAAASGSDVRGQYKAINEAIKSLVEAVWKDGDANLKAKVSSIILAHEHDRAQKDRRWFLPFGFDTMDAA